MRTILQDLRFGIRMLGKSPGFVTVAALTLAFGLGANTAIFSVVESVLLNPLPYPYANRLVAIYARNSRYTGMPVSYLNFKDWQDDSRSFAAVGAWEDTGYTLTDPGSATRVRAELISSSFFPALGVRLFEGRNFQREDQHPESAPVVIISHRLLEQRFAGDTGVLGRQITLSASNYTIIGVLPRGFRYRRHADVYTPLGRMLLEARSDRSVVNSIYVVARMKAHVTLAEAQADMNTVQGRLDQLYPKADTGLGAQVVPLKQDIVGKTGRTLILLFGAVALVLLIACANVANLLLARSAGRKKEFAIRSALGASRRRVIFQLLTESVLLALVGGSLGLFLGELAMRPMIAAVPGGLPRSHDIHLSLPVFLFAFAASVLTGFLFGLAPALALSRAELQRSLKEGGRTSAVTGHRFQRSLAVGEVALTVMLLVGAGLLIRTIRRLWDVNPGFDSHHLLTFDVALSRTAVHTGPEVRDAYRSLLSRLARIPGVESVSMNSVLPFSGEDYEFTFWPSWETATPPQDAPWALSYLTTPGYFRTMQIPLLQGRSITAKDTEKSPMVIVVDTQLVHRIFHGRSAIGQQLNLKDFGMAQIVGVVGHVRHWSLGPSPYPTIEGEIYFPFYQLKDQWMKVMTSGVTVVMRTSEEPMSVLPEVRRVVYGFHSDEPVYHVRTMEQMLATSMASQRFPMLLLGIFAGLALLLAAGGVYGLISYTVSQRNHEIGIRMALGARASDVLRMVVAQGVGLALVGAGIGIAAALAFTRLLAKLLYGVNPADPLTIAAVSVGVVAVVALASYVPARRAARVDPAVALRRE
jgi:predicted permease